MLTVPPVCYDGTDGPCSRGRERFDDKGAGGDMEPRDTVDCSIVDVLQLRGCCTVGQQRPFTVGVNEHNDRPRATLSLNPRVDASVEEFGDKCRPNRVSTDSADEPNWCACQCSAHRDVRCAPAAPSPYRSVGVRAGGYVRREPYDNVFYQVTDEEAQ
jgi:hypothetical protein